MLFPRAVKAVIFDMDGLLFNTERLYGEAMLEAAAEMGLPLTTDVVHRTVGSPVTASRLMADVDAALGEQVLDVARNDRGKRTYIITTRRIISGEELK